MPNIIFLSFKYTKFKFPHFIFPFTIFNSFREKLPFISLFILYFIGDSENLLLMDSLQLELVRMELLDCFQIWKCWFFETWNLWEYPAWLFWTRGIWHFLFLFTLSGTQGSLLG